MWDPSKKLLLLLIIVFIVLSILSYFLIDWNHFNTSTNSAIEELSLTFVFIGFMLNFLFTFIKKVKEDK